MKVLITGVSGFVGKNLVKYYLKEKHKVTGIYRNKKPKFLKNKNLNLICANLSKKKISLKNKTPIKYPNRAPKAEQTVATVAIIK